MNNKNFIAKKMKALLLGSVIVMFLIACKKESKSPTTPIVETPDTSAVIKYQGTFMNGPYGNVTGAARIYLANGKYTLELNNINISNGPDLHVYLSKEVMPISFIDLGRLRSTTGNQIYDIPGSPDFSVYKYALIHCQAFNHLFGSAALQ